MKIAFFGSSNFSVIVLEKLKQAGILPSLIITTEDKPKGRKLIITPPETKVWAEKNNVEVFQPSKLREESVAQKLKEIDWDIFVVASYGKIIPAGILEIPKHKTLNIHPSLLPRLRGASPIQTAILEENETGVTIIMLDEQMDHGPILAQKKIEIENWPPKENDLEKVLAEEGAELLTKVLPKWISGEIKEIPQDETKATFTKKVEKNDGLIDINGDPILNYKKIQAYSGWPNAFFFTEKAGKNTRVIIKSAELKDGKLLIKKVVPEGKKEMDYEAFLRN